MDGKEREREREKELEKKKTCSVRSLEFSSCHHVLVYLLEDVRNSSDLTGFRLCPGLTGTSLSPCTELFLCISIFPDCNGLCVSHCTKDLLT
jgi:hypothetical protein